MKKQAKHILSAAIIAPVLLCSMAFADANQLSLTNMQSSQTQADNNAQLFGQPSAQSKAAFNAVASQSMPLTPAQIIKLHKMLNATQAATAASPTTPPAPVTTTRMVSLQPGALPPVIRLSQGFVSSLVFVDNTGQPWPIESYDVGNSQAFNVQSPQKGGNTLMLQAMSPYTYGNMAIKLSGLSTPIMITLIPGQKEMDYRVDLHVEGTGPNAKASVGSTGLPAPASNVLLSVLNGVTPKGAKVLNTSDANTEAWSMGDKMFLRTKLTVVSPGWISMMRSADGTIAYEMQKTSSVLVSEDGNLVNLKVEGV
ncbi:MAG: type IV secretion protein IcmK [Legionellaceae bacterium]|nr:type IV secretion protein IcmK [Legionellaceae bacterium]|tara:strand:+ start:35 stop:967 length:933 start_codon:yes stop_codon:yes gene_type:complete